MLLLLFGRNAHRFGDGCNGCRGAFSGVAKLSGDPVRHHGQQAARTREQQCDPWLFPHDPSRFPMIAPALNPTHCSPSSLSRRVSEQAAWVGLCQPAIAQALQSEGGNPRSENRKMEAQMVDGRLR